MLRKQFIIFSCSFLFMISGHFAAAKTVVNIGVIHDGPWQRYTELSELIKAETTTLLANDFDVQFPHQYDLHGGWQVSGVKKGINQLLGDPNVDLVIASGVAASHLVLQKKNLPKPVIATYAIDIGLQNLPYENDKSGVENLNYLISDKEVTRALEVFYEVSGFANLGVLVNPLIDKAIPGFAQAVKSLAKNYPFEIEVISISQPFEQSLSKIPSTIDAVFLAPLLQLSDEELTALAESLTKRGLPSFSYWGQDEVEKGVLMSTAPKADMARFARRVALNIQRILLGDNAADVEVTFHEGEAVTINMETARELNIWPSWDIITEATLLNEDAGIDKAPVTLEGVVKRAVEHNLSVAIAEKDAEIVGAQLGNVRANLLPQIEVNYQGRQIDRDRAKASFGILPEFESTAQLKATQAIFSEPAWAGYSAQKHLIRAKHYDVAKAQLDIALEAAESLLNILRAEALLRIRKNDLKLTRSNYELAKMREKIGVANASEVFRWESEIAQKKREVLFAAAQLEQARVILNRLLGWPQTTPLKVEEAKVSNPMLLVSDERLNQYLDNPWTVFIFKNFMVDEGLRQSPELKALRQQITAQQRIVRSAKRAFYLPSLGMQFDMNKIVSRDGEGTSQDFDFSTLGEPFEQVDFEVDNLNWTIALEAKLPIFVGGKRISDVRKNQEELARLQLIYDSTAAQIEENIRRALHSADATFTTIELSQQSARAAHKNLELVKDAYTRGVLSIVDLIDAQNAVITSDEAAASSVYDFLIDLMRVQRTIGQFDFFLTKEAREEWFVRLKTYFSHNWQAQKNRTRQLVDKW